MCLTELRWDSYSQEQIAHLISLGKDLRPHCCMLKREHPARALPFTPRPGGALPDPCLLLWPIKTRCSEEKAVLG